LISLDYMPYGHAYEQRSILLNRLMEDQSLMPTGGADAVTRFGPNFRRSQIARPIALVLLMVLSSFAAIPFISNPVSAASDQDGDGLSYGLEYLIKTAPNDWDTDNDGLPDGWEWKYGLDPLSTNGVNGALGDQDGDGMTNLQEYTYSISQSWDLTNTPTVLDNGVWWNGTIPVRNWDEENAMQYNQLSCGAAGSDGTGNTILCDEDPVGNICTDGFDNDRDGQIDSNDPDKDGDQDCATNDDDGDGDIDEDPDGWDTDGDGLPDGWEASNGLDPTDPSNNNGANGDPDSDGLINIWEYVNPSWTTNCGSQPCFRPGPPGSTAATETVSPCNPVQGIGPTGCLSLTAEVDGITTTNPNRADTDGDGLNDSYEALTLLTDPTSRDTDSDGIEDGVEVNGAYGNPPQASDPRNNNTDGDELDDGDEDLNGNGVLDAGETDPTRREDSDDFDGDGIQNWEENLSCTSWDLIDTDFGGVHDGDERNISHGTDPCDSLINFVTTHTNWDSSFNQLTLTDASGFNPSGGRGWYNVSGTWTPFSYGSRVNSLLSLVSFGPPTGTTEVANFNGSFCHTSATADGSIQTTRQYCDDDYTDSDGDGLADWQETLGTFGWFSNPGLFDSDSDGVNDLDEILNNTDPLQPCHNTLDDDQDGLNNYFETSTGCPLSYIGIGNGSSDLFSTSINDTDTDGGGVNDFQEYRDGTNPEDVPSDDILPDDTDGDGIPDAIENMTGTDWRNPDTDGGGMIDGLECPFEFWFTLCSNAPFNPWDPSDDIINNDVVFWANNTTIGVVDVDQIHYWRVNTFDSYTGGAYAAFSSVHPDAEINIPYDNVTNLPDSNFDNGTVVWDVQFNFPMMSGYVPMPSNLENITFWFDTEVAMSRTNDTHRYTVTAGSLDSMRVETPSTYYDWATISSTTIPHTNSSYNLILPVEFSDPSNSMSLVKNITDAVINNASAIDAYSKSLAIEDFLINGNATTEFKLNYDGAGVHSSIDLTTEILELKKEGTCAEFATVFVTMARLAGLPARTVSGFRGGDWHGSGFSVTGSHSATWAEVRMMTNAGAGSLDLGWVPFNPCPEAEQMEIVNQTISPQIFDRENIVEPNVTGQLRFAENSTAAINITVQAYMIERSFASFVPGVAEDQVHLIGTAETDADGNFTINGTVPEPILPGIHNIVVVHRQSGYVSNQGVIYDDWFNVTDDVVLNHTSPQAIDSPVVGAGASTTITGTISLENLPVDGIEEIEGLEVWLDFTTVEDGAVNLTGEVGSGGYWEIDVDLAEDEPLGNISAQLGFSGWQDTLAQVSNPPQYHLRPTSKSLTLDIREAPNLSATVQGPLSNNSVLVLDENVYINGSAVSFGVSPTNLNGSLTLWMRENGTAAAYVEVMNVTVNGTFNIVHNLSSQNMKIPSGRIDLRLLFTPSDLEATDEVDFSSDNYWLRGLLNLTIIADPTLRGTDGTIIVEITDHRGAIGGLNLTGEYAFYHKGNWFNTTVDPSSTTLVLSIPVLADAIAQDELIEGQFNGSDWFKASFSNTTMRVQGDVDISFTISQQWIDRGATAWVNGSISDAVYGTPVLGNDSMVMFAIFGAEGFRDLGVTSLNNSTGNFSFQFTMPTDLGSAVYELDAMPDFFTMAPPGGPYWAYASETPTTEDVGVISQSAIDSDLSSVLVELGDSIDLTVHVSDVADNSNISGATIEYILDWGATNQSIGTAISGADGNATLSWTANGFDPGWYDLRIQMADDLTDTLSSPNAGRWYGSHTMMNVTLQVASNINIISVPSTVTAGINFNLTGQVEDGGDAARPMVSALRLDVFWLSEPDELLIDEQWTNATGAFNFSVPTDVLNNGTTRGPRTLVVSVVNESSPFYLTSSAQSNILVMGVASFEGMQPLNAAVVNRGDSINFSARLVESSDRWTPLQGFDVSATFDETPMANTNTTNAIGEVQFTYQVPFDQPLGLVPVVFNFTGDVDLLPTEANLQTITVRARTTTVFFQIVENPQAGNIFNISGNVTSDNGSGLQWRDGNVLISNMLFRIDGVATGFSVVGGAIQANGSWNATITLDQTFARGTHLMEAIYVPTVNFYIRSNDTQTFDSRGFSRLSFNSPVLDGIGTPSLNDRVNRGDDVDAQLVLRDNTGKILEGENVTLYLDGSTVNSSGLTDESGLVNISLPIPADISPGIHTLIASFAGIAGSTGVSGSSATIDFVVLANTSITIESYDDALVAGERLDVVGKLLDDRNQSLLTEGTPASGIVHLIVDGIIVSNVNTDPISGNFSLSWVLPIATTAGEHQIEVRFTGGKNWVDPIGIGESANPEFYQPSSMIVKFNVSVPTKVALLTPGGEADRDSSFIVQGRLLDIVDNPLDNRTIAIYLDGKFETLTQTGITGDFTVVIPVHSDAKLGETVLNVMFNGSQFHLPSQTNATWSIYSPTVSMVNIQSTVAVGQVVQIDGFVGDNQMQAIENHELKLIVEGITISDPDYLVTDSNGNFTFEWEVESLFSDGENMLQVVVEQQDWYRASSANTTFFLAHRSNITLQFDSSTDITRGIGDVWSLSGRLYDQDSPAVGLNGEIVNLKLDDEMYGIPLVTDNDGFWSATIEVDEDMSKGRHTISVHFMGTKTHLASENTGVGVVWTDVKFNIGDIDMDNPMMLTRSDSVDRRISISGNITEVGGGNTLVDGVEFTLGTGLDCTTFGQSSRCIPKTLAWLQGEFTLTATAPSWMNPGYNILYIDVDSNSSEYRNGASIIFPVFVQIDADITLEFEEIVEGKQEDIIGEVTIIAKDNGSGVEGIDVQAYLLYENGSSVMIEDNQVSRSKVTDSDGVASFVFNADPPYGNADEYGELMVWVVITDSLLTTDSKTAFSEGEGQPESLQYRFSEEEGIFSWWVYLMLIITAFAVAGFIIMKRRSDDLLSEVADHLYYTAELLASGDEIREAIFSCYESLVSTLMSRGFLRRDFETVREFEAAIRAAIPISEEALVALDNVFEEARYSRIEMGESHRSAAQTAMERCIAEISVQTDVPDR